MEVLILKNNSQTLQGVRELFLETFPDFVPAGTLTISKGLSDFFAYNNQGEKIGVVSEADFGALWQQKSASLKQELTIPCPSDHGGWSEE